MASLRRRPRTCPLLLFPIKWTDNIRVTVVEQRESQIIEKVSQAPRGRRLLCCCCCHMQQTRKTRLCIIQHGRRSSRSKRATAADATLYFLLKRPTTIRKSHPKGPTRLFLLLLTSRLTLQPKVKKAVGWARRTDSGKLCEGL